MNTNGVWTSKESIYVSYEAAGRRLYFRDGSFWQMDTRSAGFEDDMGTLYPSVMQDTNGNQILVRYDTGINASWPNSSGRILEIEDVRAVAYGNGRTTYVFSYSYPVAGWPHVSGMSNLINSGESWTMSYYTDQTLVDPFTAQSTWGNTAFPLNLTNANGTYHFDFGLSGEMSKVTYPAGGYLRWTYLTSAFTSPTNPSGPPRSIREIDYRYIEQRYRRAPLLYRTRFRRYVGRKICSLESPVARCGCGRGRERQDESLAVLL